MKAHPESDTPLPSRLKAGEPGLGDPDQSAIEVRAAELARSDGRAFFTDADLQRAAEELGAVSGPPAPPEESEPVMGEITAWDDAPDESGHRVEPAKLEDEQPMAEQLVEEGIEEADHDTRNAAADTEELS